MSSGGGFDLLHFAHDKGVYLSVQPFIIAFAAANFAFLTLDPAQALRNFVFLALSSPVWLPIVLGRFAFLRWVSANRAAFLARQEYVLLEVRIPRDVRKTPLAMEAVFSSLHLAGGESTWWKRIVNGAIRASWSFEIVSLGGHIHFFVRTRAGLRRGVESAIYAQYPDVEIVEATDYALLTDPSHAPNNVWGAEYKTGSGLVWPIRTYIEFMNPTGPLAKPEEQIDPLAQIIEYLGSLGPKEQFWIQIMIRVSKNEKWAGKKNKKGGQYTIKDAKAEAVEGVREGSKRRVTKVDPVTGKSYTEESYTAPTRGEQFQMEALERKLSKPLFDVGIRALYTAPEEAYQGSVIGHLINIWKPISSEYESLGITRWFANFDDWPWEDPKGIHHAHVAHGLVDVYRRRAFFNEPYIGDWKMKKTEENTTIYHIPPSGVATPSIPRLQSATSGAPSNLPL